MHPPLPRRAQQQASPGIDFHGTEHGAGKFKRAAAPIHRGQQDPISADNENLSVPVFVKTQRCGKYEVSSGETQAISHSPPLGQMVNKFTCDYCIFDVHTKEPTQSPSPGARNTAPVP